MFELVSQFENWIFSKKSCSSNSKNKICMHIHMQNGKEILILQNERH